VAASGQRVAAGDEVRLMDGTTFIQDLFGHNPESPLPLTRPIEALSAILRNDRTATCEGITVISDTPIQALCGALVASGRADAAMQVKTRRGEAVCFVQSIHVAARDGGRKP
jgi:hypothetical protein